MSKLIESDPVQTLFGSEEIPAPYELVLAKVLNDNLVLIRIQDLMQRFFGALAISHMRDGEVAALRKRITWVFNPPAPVTSLAEFRAADQVTRSKAPKPTGFQSAIWTVKVVAGLSGEKTNFLSGKCEKCGQETRIIDVPAFFEHCGAVEAIPEAAVLQLRQAQGRAVNATPSDSEIYERIMRGDQPTAQAVPAPAVPASRPAPALPKVSWYVDTTLGTRRIVAEVPGEKTWFTGAPKDAANFAFGREKCPQRVIDEYAQGFVA